MRAAFPPCSRGASPSRLIARPGKQRRVPALAGRRRLRLAGSLRAAAEALPSSSLPRRAVLAGELRAAMRAAFPLVPSALLRRASSPVGEAAPRPCARWLAPPAACWRCGPLRALPCLLVPSVLLRRASLPAGEAGPRPCARWPASPARRAVSARQSRRRRGPPVRPRGGILGRLDGCAAPGNAAGLIRWRRAQLVPFQPDGESAGPLAPGPLEGGVFLLARAAAS